MANKTHSTSAEAGNFTLHLNDDGTWPIERVHAALLADIRRRLDAAALREIAGLRVLQRIDRRLAKRVKLR